jgi:hypothetical protein
MRLLTARCDAASLAVPGAWRQRLIDGDRHVKTGNRQHAEGDPFRHVERIAVSPPASFCVLRLRTRTSALALFGPGPIAHDGLQETAQPCPALAAARVRLLHACTWTKC